MKQANQSPGVALFVLSAVQFLSPFMLSAVGVALPSIGEEFQAGALQLGLVEMVFILAYALVMLPAGRMADIHGRKKVFILGIVFFIAATLLLGLSPDINLFIILRFIQGIGAALINATGMAILSSLFPPEKRGLAMGIVVAAVYLGLSTGPTLAGVVITHLGWRWVFFMALPLEVAALILTFSHLKGEWQPARGKPFDWSGSLIYMAALFALICGVTRLGDGLLYSGMLGAGILGLITFFRYESRLVSPILDTELLRTNRIFVMNNLATLINYAASFGATFFFSLYLQQIRGFSPLYTGLILMIQPLIQALLSPVAGRLSDSGCPNRIASLGMGTCALALGLSATIGANTSLVQICAVLVLLGFGFALFSSPNGIVVMGSVAPAHYGFAASYLSTMRTTGMLMSMTLITLILGLFMGKTPVTPQTADAFLASMQTGFLIFTAIGIVGVLCSLGQRNIHAEEDLQSPC